METRLKERLIGATVLVLAAVLFVPMVLDGPGSNRQVSQSVPLPDAEETRERRTVRIDLAQPQSVPKKTADAPATGEPAAIDLVPEQEAEERAAQAQPSEPVRAAREEAPAPANEPATETAGASSPWTVQAGSFSQQDNAEALAGRLRELGFPAYVSEYDDGERMHYRVRVGGFASRDAAQAKADEVRARTGEPARATPSR